MAEPIDVFPGQQHQSTRRYPWDEWCDGRIWKLVRGVDFDAPVDQFRNRFYPQANNRGLKVRSAKLVEGEQEILVVQFFDPTEAMESPNHTYEFEEPAVEEPAPEAEEHLHSV